MTGCQAVQPQGQGSDRGRGETKRGYRVRQLHTSFLLLDASSISFHDAHCTLTQERPRLNCCHRGIILNDDYFYISLHFLCVSPTMPLWLYFQSYFLCCSPSTLSWWVPRPTPEPIQTTLTASPESCMHPSYFLEATETEARCSGLLVFSLQLMHYSAMNRSVT